MEVTHGIKRNAVLVILKNENQFLLLKRKKDPHKGYYTPIGGKLEPFENPNDCAIRETFEETGIDAPQLRYIGSLVESSPTKYNWNCLVYFAEIPFQKAPPCNEGELSWIAIQDLSKYPIPKTDILVYEYALAQKAFLFNVDYDEQLNILSFREEISGEEINL